MWLELQTDGNLGKLISVVVVVICLGFIIGAKSWFSSHSCDAPLQHAETELTDAVRRIREIDSPRRRTDLSCPAYRHFLQVAGRAHPVFKRCNPKTAPYSQTAGNLENEIAVVSQRLSEYCANTP